MRPSGERRSMPGDSGQRRWPHSSGAVRAKVENLLDKRAVMALATFAAGTVRRAIAPGL